MPGHSITDDLTSEYRQLNAAARLHWIHWTVILGSLLLTLVAWQISKQNVEQQTAARFERATLQITALIQERMTRYEEALRAGVAVIGVYEGRIERARWHTFAKSLNIQERFPGIHGIGVIHFVERENASEFLSWQRQSAPDFRIYPEHTQKELWPITYIEPEVLNYKAIGLDMAHEENRFNAARNARNTGLSRITGPITLVQDENRQPGFLFYSPFYLNDAPEGTDKGERKFAGLVYAPFVVANLMTGTLERTRLFEIRILDGKQILYDEWTKGIAPQHSRANLMSLYGREWRFELRSTPAFDAANSSAQPIFILVGGLTIDALLLTLFMLLARANRHALDIAGRLAKGYLENEEKLEQSVQQLSARNAELEQFAYIASHDLQEPLRTLKSYSDLFTRKYSDSFDDRGKTALRFMNESANRMSGLVQGLLEYSQVGRSGETAQIDCEHLLKKVTADLNKIIAETATTLNIKSLPTVEANENDLWQLFTNLIRNSIKFHREGVPPVIDINCRKQGTQWVFTFKDNGIGINPSYLEKVFNIFTRLHAQSAYTGSGIGLAQCRKIVERYGGSISVDSDGSTGTTFTFSLGA